MFVNILRSNSRWQLPTLDNQLLALSQWFKPHDVKALAKIQKKCKSKKISTHCYADLSTLCWIGKKFVWDLSTKSGQTLQDSFSADLCDKFLIWKLSQRSTQYSPSYNSRLCFIFFKKQFAKTIMLDEMLLNLNEISQERFRMFPEFDEMTQSLI